MKKIIFFSAILIAFLASLIVWWKSHEAVEIQRAKAVVYKNYDDGFLK